MLVLRNCGGVDVLPVSLPGRVSLQIIQAYKEQENMARQRRTPPNEEKQPVKQGKYWLPTDAKWGGFINIRLEEEAKDDFHAWLEQEGERFWSLLDAMLGEGIKVTLTYDRENDAYVCAITGALVSGSNERYCSTSRAGQFSEVLALTVWKHYALAEGDYGGFRPANSSFMKWG